MMIKIYCFLQLLGYASIRRDLRETADELEYQRIRSQSLGPPKPRPMFKNSCQGCSTQKGSGNTWIHTSVPSRKVFLYAGTDMQFDPRMKNCYKYFSRFVD